MAYEFTQIYPEMSVTVFDLPQVIAMSDRFQPKDQNDRVTFVAGEFLFFLHIAMNVYVVSMCYQNCTYNNYGASDGCLKIMLPTERCERRNVNL